MGDDRDEVNGVVNTAFTGAFIGGLQLEGVVFNNASGLATAGGTISLSGTVYDNTNPNIVIETITSGTVITSADPGKTTITAGATAITNAATTPTAFSSFQAPVNGGLTLTLATVAITSNGALGTNLASVVVPDGGVPVGKDEDDIPYRIIECRDHGYVRRI